MVFKFNTDLSACDVRSILDYDPSTGIFVWKKTRGSRAAGQSAGSLGSHGYMAIRINNRMYLSHRLAWLFVYGEWPVEEIDHADGDKINNKIINLRAATRTENNRNTRAKGYHFISKLKKFRAVISINRRPYHIGLFDTEEDARAAYLAESKRLFGEFSSAHRVSP